MLAAASALCCFVHPSVGAKHTGIRGSSGRSSSRLGVGRTSASGLWEATEPRQYTVVPEPKAP